MKSKVNVKHKKTTESKKTMDSLEIPKLLQADLFHLETNGNEEMILDGCTAVLDYGEKFIKLRAKSRAICFTGESLCLKSYVNGEAVIEGNIFSITFEE